jgi:hypothetical protein
MSAPNLSIQPEPLASGKLVYLPLAAGTAQRSAHGRLFLRVDVKNNEAQAVTLDTLTLSFPGSDIAAQAKNVAKRIAAGATLRWWFPQPADDVLFKLPAPTGIRLACRCDGFDKAREFSFPLAAHVSPVSGGAYLFPSQRADLELGEFWAVNGCIHGMGAEGSQSFGYDMGVWGVDHDNGAYSWLHPGRNGKHNADHRIFGKAVRAMADGIVLEAIADCPDNPAPLALNGDKAHDDALWAAQQAATWGAYEASHGGAAKVHAGGGNHVYIQHGDEVMLYAHMQKGSLADKLLKPGAVVHAGDLLGKAGNSGNSSAPHLHIHAVQSTAPETGPLRPIVLRHAWAIDNDLIIGSPQKGGWSAIEHQGVPEGDPLEWNKRDVFLWPDKALPEWPEIVKLSVAESDYQALYDTMKSRGFYPAGFDAYTLAPLPGTGLSFFNLVFRPASGLVYEARHGLSGAEYLDACDHWVKHKRYRLAQVESYFSHALGRVAYAALFVKGAGPEVAAYHGLTQAEHQARFEQLTQRDGYAPLRISVVSRNGERQYTALFERKDVGRFDAHSTLSVAAWQKQFDINAGKGLGLAYLNAYLHDGEINIVGIWHAATAGTYAEHHLNNAEFDALLKKQRKANRSLRGVTGYQRGLLPNFAAFWSR